MKNYRMVIQYDGTRYDGWQKQGNTGNTIQSRLEAVLGRMTGEKPEVIGSGRTDAGVHAAWQTANVHMNTEKTPQEIMSYINQYLPDDIAVIRLEEAPDRFHSRFNATGKVYTYWIEMSPKCPVFQRKYIYTLGERLDVEVMRQAAKLLCGTHDFKSFCTKSSGKKSSVRTVNAIDIHERGTQLEIQVSGGGFLYNMVRILVGTLIEAGLGKRKPESMKEILEAKDRRAAGPTAPPCGLFLTAVQYDENWE